MSTKRQKDQKRKDREKLNNVKKLQNRNKLRAQRKLDLQQEENDKQIHILNHGKLKPFIKDPEKAAKYEKIKSENAMEKIKKNLEYLENLEKEYEAEQKAREELNAKLESEGHFSLKEKLDALHEKALDETGKRLEYEEIVEAKSTLQ